MQKNLFISLISLAFFILSAILTRLIIFLPEWTTTFGFIMGFSIFFISMLVGIIGRKQLPFNIFSFALSGIALSFFTFIWCQYKGTGVSIFMLLANAGLASLFTLMYYLVILISPFREHKTIFAIIFTLIGIILVPFFLIREDLSYFSTFGLYLILAMSFNFVGISKKEDKKQIMKHLSYASFCVIIVGVIVLIAVAGGDLDIPDIDIDFGVGSGKKKPKNPK